MIGDKDKESHRSDYNKDHVVDSEKDILQKFKSKVVPEVLKITLRFRDLLEGLTGTQHMVYSAYTQLMAMTAREYRAKSAKGNMHRAKSGGNKA